MSWMIVWVCLASKDAREWAAVRRASAREASCRVAVEARASTWFGTEGIWRCRNDGFVVGLAARASWTAEDCKLLETRLANSGMRVSRDEKGRDNSKGVMLSGDSSLSAAMSNGGSRSKRSNSSSGKAGDVAPAGPGFPLLSSATQVGPGLEGAADERACARRCFFAAFSR